MKTYISKGQLRLVGKAWEVRQYLKMMLEGLSADQPLTALLDASAPNLKNKLNCPVQISIADAHPKLHRRLRQKTTDLHASPCPSK